MKTAAAAAFLFLTANSVHAQSGPGASHEAHYTVVSRGANSRIWRGTNWTQDASGQWVPRIHSYTELANGLCHKDAHGNYVDSSESIIILPDGSAAATNCSTSVFLPGDIGSGVIRLVTSDGKVLQNGPAFLAYDDGISTVIIAAVTNSVGQLISSNEVLYPDIFRGAGFRADLLCTVRKSGFESDLVFREQIPNPESLGLGPNSRLQLLTEWFDTPEPVQATNPSPNGSDGLSDVTLRFGSAKIGHGRAFVTEKTDSTLTVARSSGRSTPVYKSWIHLSGGRTFLVESLPYRRLAPQLHQLPTPAGHSASAIRIWNKGSFTQALPSRTRVQRSGRRIQVARTDIGRDRGVVLDYVELDASEVGDFEFSSGTTYFVNGDFIIDGTGTFDGGAILKYSEGGFIEAVGPPPAEVWNNDAFHLTIFTSKDDNSVGDQISGSSGNPTTLSGGNYYVWVSDDGNGYSTAMNASFSYAAEAVAPSAACNFTNCQFIKCEMITQAGGDGSGTPVPLYFQNSLFSRCGFAIWNVESVDPGALLLENVTIDQCTNFFSSNQGCSWCYEETNLVYATNSIVANTLDDPTAIFFGSNNGFYDSPEFGTNPKPINTSPFQSGPLGSYYLSSGSPFIDAGTTTADRVGLYEYTTQTTPGSMDGRTFVDLGFHYLALDSNGNPVSTLISGVPDYVSDTDGNGLPDSWEIKYFGHIGVDPDADPAGDGLEIIEDYLLGINPTVNNLPNGSPGLVHIHTPLSTQ